MQFKKTESLPLLSCETCKNTGLVSLKKCKQCHGMAFGIARRGRWLYWDFPLTKYNLALQRGRRILRRVQLVTVFVLWLNAWIWSGFLIHNQGSYRLLLNPKRWILFFTSLNHWAVFLFWFGVLCILYLCFFIIRKKESVGKIEPMRYHSKSSDSQSEVVAIDSWAQAIKFPRRKKFNIAGAFTEEALAALAKSYAIADSLRAKELKPEHLLSALLSFNRISNIFIRLGIPASSIQKELEPLFSTDTKQTAYAGVPPVVPAAIEQIIFQASE